MARTSCVPNFLVVLTVMAAGAVLLLPHPAAAQEEVASALRRYKDREVSTGYYEEFEVRPRRLRPFVEVPGVQGGIFSYSPTSARVRSRSRLADSHMGIAFYKEKTCQSCHPEQAKDIHTVRGNLTCRQCHGGEPIASIQFFSSPMNPIRRHAYVCAKCHEGASASFASYVIHQPDPGSAAARKGFPILYFAFWFMTVLLVGTLAFFIPHAFLVGVRELFRARKALKVRAAMRIKRFTTIQRLFHLFLMLTFLLQTATGFSRLYVTTAWGRQINAVLGGYDTSLVIHTWAGLMMILGFLVHTAYLLTRINWKTPLRDIFGPDSLVPNLTDLKQFGQQVRWFFGLGSPPRFNRWTYWEKFDYWAVYWGLPLLAITGLMLMYPIASSRFLPGWTLNIAALLHRAEALLAVSYIFIVHFFIGHLRPSSFPMNEAMFSGSVPVEELVEEKPAWVERLRGDGRLGTVSTLLPTPWYRATYFVFGYAVVISGLYLLINGIINVRHITLH